MITIPRMKALTKQGILSIETVGNEAVTNQVRIYLSHYKSPSHETSSSSQNFRKRHNAYGTLGGRDWEVPSVPVL